VSASKLFFTAIAFENSSQRSTGSFTHSIIRTVKHCQSLYPDIHLMQSKTCNVTQIVATAEVGFTKNESVLKYS
jgi:hypothetical protein